jgi:hypothetical protein
MENTNNVNTGTTNTGSENNTNIDYGKLEEIINKGINQKENSILKSYFSQQGLDEVQMKEAIENYKNSKKVEENKNTKEFEDLTNNYNNLKKIFNQERLNNSINLSLIKKGLSDEQIPFILKMVDTDGILNEKDEINQEKLNENIENLFKAFPGLVNKTENKSFIQIGTSNNNSQYEESSDVLLRKAFGLKDKK